MKDRLAQTSREKLTQVKREEQLKADRKRKAALFINMLKGAVTANVATANVAAATANVAAATANVAADDTPASETIKEPNEDTEFEELLSLIDDETKSTESLLSTSKFGSKPIPVLDESKLDSDPAKSKEMDTKKNKHCEIKIREIVINKEIGIDENTDRNEINNNSVKSRMTCLNDLDGFGTSPDISLYSPSKDIVRDIANCDSSVSVNSSGLSTDTCPKDDESFSWIVTDETGNTSVTEESGNMTVIETKDNERSWAINHRHNTHLLPGKIYDALGNKNDSQTTSHNTQCETSSIQVNTNTLSCHTELCSSASNNLHSGVDNDASLNTHEIGNGQYSSFITTSEETSSVSWLDKNYMQEQQEDKQSLSSFNNKRRKRNESLHEGEYTPKRHKNILPSPQYAKTSFPISPIASSSIVKDTPFKTDSMENTPVVLSKFQFSENCNAVSNSTPVFFNENNRHQTDCKSKKTIWSTTDQREDLLSEFSIFSSKSEDPVLPTAENVIEEIAMLCEKGIAKGKKAQQHAHETIQTDHNISKIDVDTIIKSDSDKININENSAKSTSSVTESCSKTDFLSEPYSITESNISGRFRNVDASISIIVIDDDVVVSEDILGIDELDDLDLDENEEETLLNEDEKEEIDETKHEKTVVAMTEVKVTKSDTETKDMKTCEDRHGILPSEKELVKNETINEQKSKSGEESDVIELFSHNMMEYKAKASLSLKGNQQECKELVKETDINSGNVMAQADAVSEIINTTKTVMADNVAKDNDKKYENDISIVKNEFDTDKDRMEDQNSLMAEVRRRWKSDGIPCQDTNLTVATNFRRQTKHSGLQIVSGVLEGEHISCLNLYEDELSNVKQKHGKQQIKRAKNAHLGISIKEVLDKLYHQKEILNFVKINALYELRKELAEKQQAMKQRHSMEINHLNYNQGMELRQLQSSYTFPPYVLQRNIMQLGIEHGQQRDKLKTHHMREYGMLCEQLNSVLNMQTEKYTEQIVPIQECITSLENRDVSKTNSKHGPLIMVQVRKAPHKNNKTPSKMPLWLPADIAQAVLIEEEIYNHFYAFD